MSITKQQLKDLENPDWESASRVHDWMNYINREVRDIWSSFTKLQKELLKKNAEEIADREEWD